MLSVLLTFFLISGIWAANTFTAGENGCVAAWLFESATLNEDATTNNYDLTAAGTPSADTDVGDFQQGASSAYFDGATDYYTLAEAALSAGYPLQQGSATKNMTIAAWIKVDTLPASGNYGVVYSKYTASADTVDYAVYTDAGGTRMRWRVGYNGGSNWETEEIMEAEVYGWITADTWYHVALTWNDATKAWIAYRNGAALANATCTNAAYNTESSAVGIGGRSDGTSLLTGWLDEVVLFNQVLTPTQIGYLYDGTYPDGPVVGTVSQWWQRRRH